MFRKALSRRHHAAPYTRTILLTAALVGRNGGSRVRNRIAREVGLYGHVSERMRWPTKQFELSCQRRDPQISLGARELGFKCV